MKHLLIEKTVALKNSPSDAKIQVIVKIPFTVGSEQEQNKEFCEKMEKEMHRRHQGLVDGLAHTVAGIEEEFSEDKTRGFEALSILCQHLSRGAQSLAARCDRQKAADLNSDFLKSYS